MLGGSVYIALLRWAISIAGVTFLFFQMSEQRYHLRKTVICYTCFSMILLSAAGIWYILDWESCAKMSALTMYLCFAVFSLFMSIDPIYLRIYKLVLTFYLLAVFLIGAIETSIIFFHGNIWVDMIMRVLLIVMMAYFIEKKIKTSIRGFSYYVEQEIDRFSITIMILSLLFGIGYILNPSSLDQTTPYRLFQIFMNLFLTGALQLLIFRLYLHIGKEKAYLKENQLMQMNQRLLERNLEILENAAESGKRIRHDARHHNAVIAEYARRGQNTELLQYLKEYSKETESPLTETVCPNIAVNNLLMAYTDHAQKQNIKVTLDIELLENLPIPNIDLVTILANAYENAIYGCIEAKKQDSHKECFIQLVIRRKNNKLVIRCSNTCRPDAEIKNCEPNPEATGGIGVLSIIKTSEKYDGEYDFKNNNGVFLFRLIINIPQESTDSCF